MYESSITTLAVVVIVNACTARPRPGHGGSVARANRAPAGTAYEDACRGYSKPLGVSDVCKTSSGNLPCHEVY